MGIHVGTWREASEDDLAFLDSMYGRLYTDANDVSSEDFSRLAELLAVHATGDIEGLQRAESETGQRVKREDIEATILAVLRRHDRDPLAGEPMQVGLAYARERGGDPDKWAALHLAAMRNGMVRTEPLPDGAIRVHLTEAGQEWARLLEADAGPTPHPLDVAEAVMRNDPELPLVKAAADAGHDIAGRIKEQLTANALIARRVYGDAANGYHQGVKERAYERLREAARSLAPPSEMEAIYSALVRENGALALLLEPRPRLARDERAVLNMRHTLGTVM